MARFSELSGACQLYAGDRSWPWVPRSPRPQIPHNRPPTPSTTAIPRALSVSRLCAPSRLTASAFLQSTTGAPEASRSSLMRAMFGFAAPALLSMLSARTVTTPGARRQQEEALPLALEIMLGKRDMVIVSYARWPCRAVICGVRPCRPGKNASSQSRACTPPRSRG